MMKLKPFKVDLGLGNLWGEQPKRKTTSQKKPLPRTRSKYAIYTDSQGTVIRHTFKNEEKAKAFWELARRSGQYDKVSRPRLDL